MWLTKNNGRVFRLVLYQSVSGVGAEVSGDTNMFTFSGWDVFWPVWQKQLGPWAVSSQVPWRTFANKMYLKVYLICCCYNLFSFFFTPGRLSPSVLQGFSCTSVQRMSKRKVQQMVRACRPRRRRAKIELKESQVKFGGVCVVFVSNILNIEMHFFSLK